MFIDYSWLYLEPIGKCDLKCKVCYTKKYPQVIPESILKHLISQYLSNRADGKLYWCGGGEILLYPSFPAVVNWVSRTFPSCRQSIQTNGMHINCLKEIDFSSRIDFRVSLDVPKRFQEWNRGKGSYDEALAFSRCAYERGFPIEIRTLVTRENVTLFPLIESNLKKTIGGKTRLTGTPIMKTKAFHNCRLPDGYSDYTFTISPSEIKGILGANSYVTYSNSIYLSINPSGIYSCCDMIHKLADLNEGVASLAAVQAKLFGSLQSCIDCLVKKYCTGEA